MYCRNTTYYGRVVQYYPVLLYSRKKGKFDCTTTVLLLAAAKNYSHVRKEEGRKVEVYKAAME